MHLHVLPDDILSLIVAFLDPESFLALCRSSKTLYAYRQHPAYWRTKTSSTFRIPISPLLKVDGARWYWLYKRLRTQTKLFTWGQGIRGNLGPGRFIPALRVRGPPRRGHGPVRTTFTRVNSYWPTEAHVPDEVGVVADLQCGGWSTTILSSVGKLFSTGILNATDGRLVGKTAAEFERLTYLTQSTSNIAHFSAGRAHVLALTDSGEIITWDRINANGLKVLSRHGGTLAGTPSKVVAGWDQSSAYVPELGIVYWKPLVNNQENNTHDAREIKEKIVPGTARRVLNDKTTAQVSTHIVLEGFLVFLINGHLWACGVDNDNQEDLEPKNPAFPVPGYVADNDQLQDLQGGFRNFVVFSSSGRVLAGNTDYLRRCSEIDRQYDVHHLPNDVPKDPSYKDWTLLDELLAARPADIPALQNTGVIAVAFGDYHFHALHSNGKITTYGTQSQSCGALGLGEFRRTAEGPNGGSIRGLISQGASDSKLLPVAELKGREVWFEHEKRDWLTRVAKDTKREILLDPERLTVLSQWIEQYGRRWSDGPGTIEQHAQRDSNQHVLDNESDFHLDPYFALGIGAAGWHSGALVLVDEERAQIVRQKWLEQPKVPDVEDTEKSEVAEDDHPTKHMPGHFDSTDGGLPQDKDDGKELFIWDSSSQQLAFDDPDGWTGQSFNEGTSEGAVDGVKRPWKGGKPTAEELGLPLSAT